MLKKYQSVLSVLAFTLIGLAVGYGIGKLLKGSGPRLDIGIAIVPIAILVLWLVLAVHELGHILGGLLAGFRFYFYAVGPLRIDRVGEQIKVSFNRTLSLWGGIAASLPDSNRIADTATLRNQMLMAVAGGPIASLIGILAAIPGNWLWTSNQHLAASLLIFAVGSFCIAFATMLPIGNAGFVNDGARILHLLRRDQAGDLWVASAILGSMSLNMRPRDWPAKLVEAITKDVQPTYDGVLSMWTRHCYHLDRDEFDEARHWLNLSLTHVDTLPTAARPILHSSAALFYAHIEPDLPRARSHLDQASHLGFLTKESLALSESAVLIAEGNLAQAKESLKLARQSLNALTGSSRACVEELIEQLEAKTR
jgi:hypothetical protein